MIESRWPDLAVLGSAELPRLTGEVDRWLWPELITLVQRLPADHVVIGGIMVYLHGAVRGQVPQRVTHDVDVLFNLEIAPGSLREAVQVLNHLDYKVDAASPPESTHRYRKDSGETVDILAPAGLLAMAADLDSPNHPAWSGTPNLAEAHLVWETLRQF